MSGSQSKRGRWFRFSLRSMLILICSAAMLLGWLANQAQRQRDAVQEIRRQGGWVKYDFQASSGPPRFGGWLLEKLGRDYSNRVVEASIPEDTQIVAKLPYLQFVEIVGDRVVSDRLAPLRKLANLRRLSVRSTRIDSAGIEHIAKIRSLEELDLGGTKLEGVTLSPLTALPRLQELDLCFTNVDATQVSQLNRLAKIARLRVR